MNTKKNKSPLKSNPLRNPGQSLDEEIRRQLDDKALPWMIAAVTGVVFALIEWGRWYFQHPYNPWGYTITAVLISAVCIWRLAKIKKQLRQLKLGRDGEKAVGQFLEGLREKGYKVFHDIVGDGFNVDHVLIGPSGVYSIETKTFSKPVDKDSKIQYDGERITKDGFEIDRDPVIQAKAQAAWLKELLQSSTGRTVAVKPVILFPGWYIESSGKSDVWVLNPKALGAFIDKRDQNVSKEDIGLFSYHLSRFVRIFRC